MGARSGINRLRTRLSASLNVWYVRLLTFDPALRQLRRAARAGIAAAAGYGGGYLLTTAAGTTHKIALLSGIAAMLVAINVRDDDLRGRLTTTAFATVALPGGVVVGTVLGPYRIATDVAFVVVMFLATWMRQFGVRWQALGTLAFMGYFFTLFLRLDVGELPWLVAAAIIGVAATALTRFTVLRDRPAAAMRRLLRSLAGRAGLVAHVAADLLVAPEPRRARTRDKLADVTRALDQVALQVEQQLDDPAVLPGVPDPAGLRQIVFDVQVAAERLAAATSAAADGPLDDGARAQLSGSYTALRAAAANARGGNTGVLARTPAPGDDATAAHLHGSATSTAPSRSCRRPQRASRPAPRGHASPRTRSRWPRAAWQNCALPSAGTATCGPRSR